MLADSEKLYVVMETEIVELDLTGARLAAYQFEEVKFIHRIGDQVLAQNKIFFFG